MIVLAAVGLVMLAIAGAIVVAASLAGVIPARTPQHGASSTGLLTKAVDNVRGTSRPTILRLVAGLAVGAVLMYVLRWPVLVLVAPAAFVGLPKLLGDPPQDSIRLLEALDRWVRGMLAQMSAGKAIGDAVRLSARQAPPLLADPLALVVKRLDDRWTTPQALQAMADDLNSADADAVIAALILSAQRGGTGTTVTLYALADSIQERLRALREVEAERSKPRVVVRQVTWISIATLVVFMVLSPGFFAAYGTPIGQVILVILLSLYIGSVWAMRRMTLSRTRERILRPLT